MLCFFFFQAEDGIRDAQESRGLGDVYKRQSLNSQASQAQSNNTNVTPAAVILKVDQSSTSAPVISGVLSSIANGFNSQLTGSTQIVGVENQQVLSSPVSYTHLRAHETPEHL